MPFSSSSYKQSLVVIPHLCVIAFPSLHFLHLILFIVGITRQNNPKSSVSGCSFVIPKFIVSAHHHKVKNGQVRQILIYSFFILVVFYSNLHSYGVGCFVFSCLFW
jgi:hypothetical protein